MTFEAKWQWTFEDFAVLNKAYGQLTPRRRIGYFFTPAIMVIAALYAGYSFYIADFFSGYIALSYVALILALRIFVAPWTMRRRYEQQNLDGEEIQLHASDDGLSVRTSKSDSNCNWQGVPFTSRLEKHTIIWQNLVLGISVPDRAFASTDEAQKFAAFVQEKVDGQKH